MAFDAFILSASASVVNSPPYLVKQNLHKYPKILAKFRLSVHTCILKIKTARYNSNLMMYHHNKDYVQTAIYIKLKMRNIF